MRLPRRFGIATYFSAIIGLIVFVSVGTVLLASIVTSRIALIDDLGGEFDLTTAAMLEQLDNYLGVADIKLRFIADWASRDPAALADNSRVEDMMRAAIATAPQIGAIALLRDDWTSIRMDRRVDTPFYDDLSQQAGATQRLIDGRNRGPDNPEFGWSSPIYSAQLAQPIVVLRRALWSGDRYLGVMFIAVTIQNLSTYVRDLSQTVNRNVFILRGRNDVVAHGSLLENAFASSLAKPLPTLMDLNDPMLAIIWRDDSREIIAQSRMKRSKGHFLSENGAWQVYVYAETDSYGPEPWLVGFHFDGSQGGSEVTRFWVLVGVGIALLLIFVGFGAWFGRFMARPILGIARGAAEVRSLDFQSVQALPGNRIQELDEASEAFNTMTRGLKVFETYVPKRLVQRILDSGDDHPGDIAEREATVMFTDIEGFSTYAEHMSPVECAEFLNRHFATMGDCINAESGTTDKYTGDGLMAFWGAPDDQPDHALRACRAALAIREAAHSRNAERVASGLEPVRIRIGLHTGRVVIGDIGAPGRINYTVVGDVVNVTDRLQGMGRGDDDDVAIRISGATASVVRDALAPEHIGSLPIRGRSQPLEVYSL